MMLELYHWEPNSFFLKPLIVLHEKGLAFTSHYFDPFDPDNGAKRPKLNAEAAFNPEGDGPILVDGKAVLTESFFIALYLDEAFPRVPLRPADAYGHWSVLNWGRFVGEWMAPSVSLLGCARYVAPRLKRLPAAQVEQLRRRTAEREWCTGWASVADITPEMESQAKEKVTLGVKRLESALATADWLAGNAYSLADIEAFALCHPLTSLLPDVVNKAAAPRLAGWLERIRSRPAVKAALATSRSGRPEEAFLPGPELSRWG